LAQANLFAMTQMGARIAELVARLTALERERAEIVAEIGTLQSARSGKTALLSQFLRGQRKRYEIPVHLSICP
jgi:cell division protein FtsB